MNVYGWNYGTRRTQLAAVARMVRNLKTLNETASVFAVTRLDGEPHVIAVLTVRDEEWVVKNVRPGGSRVVLNDDEKEALMARQRRVREEHPDGHLVYVHPEGEDFLYKDGHMGAW